MSNDNKNYLLSLLALISAGMLALVYWLAPVPDVQSHRLYTLLFDCVPDAFVALIAIPAVYWLFIRRGIAGLSLDPTTSPPERHGITAADRDENNMPVLLGEVNKAAHPTGDSNGATEVLIVVDVQNDFITGTLKAHKADKIIQPVNNAIRIAESSGMLVVFTKDWHPEDHWSFKKNDGPYKTHCEMHTPGAELSSELHVPPGSLEIHFGVNPGDLAYSALESRSLKTLIGNPSVKNVYVVGIALNYCVQATCRSLVDLGKNTFAIEDAIASADGDSTANEKVWKELEDLCVIRMRNVQAFAEETSNNKSLNRSGG